MKALRSPVVVLAIAALAIRLPGLASRPLWYDEAFAVLFSSKGPAAMIYGTLASEQGVAADVHPLLYYSLLWLWGGAFGTSPVVVRSLSVLIGVALVLTGYGLARSLFGRRVAAFAGIALVISPFQIHYAQEARMYALLTLILLAASWTAWRGLQRPGYRHWIVLGMLTGLAQYAHNLAVFHLIGLYLLTVIWGGKAVLRKLAVAGVLGVALYLPWLLFLPSQLARVEGSYWLVTPGAADIVQTLLAYVTGLPLLDWSLAPALAATMLVMAACVYRTAQARWADSATSRRVVWPIALTLVPPLLMYLVSQWRAVYLERALLPSAAAFALWVGWALAPQGRPGPLVWTGRAALVVGAALGLIGFHAYRGFPYAPFQALTDQLRATAGPDSAIVHSNKITALPAAYYSPDLDHRYLRDLSGSGSDTLAPATQQVLDMLAADSVSEAVGQADRVSFIFFGRELAEYAELGFVSHPHLSWLEEHFHRTGLREWGELLVYEFVR